MPPDTTLILGALFLVVGVLYSSVGHAGASGYLAVMALMGVATSVMRPTSLSLNTIVATIAFVQFFLAGHFRWRLFWPFALASVPMAFLGGRIELSPALLKPAIGVVLLASALRIAMTATKRSDPTKAVHDPPIGIALLAGGVIGLCSGLTGTGGGIFLSPLILLMGWAQPKQTAAASALFILVNSISGLIGIASTGWTMPPDLPLFGAVVAVGGIIGATYGSRFAANRTIRALLAVVLVIAGAKLVLS